MDLRRKIEFCLELLKAFNRLDVHLIETGKLNDLITDCLEIGHDKAVDILRKSADKNIRTDDEALEETINIARKGLIAFAIYAKLMDEAIGTNEDLAKMN